MTSGNAASAANGPLRSVADLPRYEDIENEHWGRQLPAQLEALFARSDVGLMSAIDGSIVLLRNHHIREVATMAEAGNTPPQQLADRAAADTLSQWEAHEPAGFAKLLANQIFTTNPPLHAPSRRMLARHFMPGPVKQLQPVAAGLAHTLLTDAADRGQVDFGLAVAEQMAGRFWGELLGLTPEEVAGAIELVVAMSPIFQVITPADQMTLVDDAAEAYLDIIETAVRRVLSQGGTPLLNEMSLDLEKIDVPGKPSSLGLSVAANLLDGFHTAGLAISNCVLELLRAPDALEELRGDVTLAGKAFQEGIRLSPPVTLTQRLALDDMTYEGVQIPAGTPLTMFWAAGNRDPLVFDEPNRFVLHRAGRQSTTFGGGVHLCPGRNVAQLLVEAVLRELVESKIELTLDGEVSWVDWSTMRQLTAFPMQLSRR